MKDDLGNMPTKAPCAYCIDLIISQKEKKEKKKKREQDHLVVPKAHFWDFL